MSNPPDLQALVRRYLDLWQDQWSAMAADPETPEIFAEMMRRTLLGAGLAASETMWQGFFAGFAGKSHAGKAPSGKPPPRDPDPEGTANDARRDGGPTASPPSDSAAQAGSEAAAAASSRRDDDLAELKARLAVLEHRLHSLEGSAAAADGRPRHGA